MKDYVMDFPLWYMLGGNAGGWIGCGVAIVLFLYYAAPPFLHNYSTFTVIV